MAWAFLVRSWVLRHMPSVSVGVVRPQGRKSHNGDRDMTDEKLYGVHPILEALHEERRRIGKIFISAQRRGAEVQRIIALAERRGIPGVTVERVQLSGWRLYVW